MIPLPVRLRDPRKQLAEKLRALASEVDALPVEAARALLASQVLDRAILIVRQMRLFRDKLDLLVKG